MTIPTDKKVSGVYYEGTHIYTDVDVDTFLSGEYPAGDTYSYLGTTIGRYAFDGNKTMTKFVGNNITTIMPYAFRNCTALKSIEFPKLTLIAADSLTQTNPTTNGYTFYHSYNIENVYLPELTTVMCTYAFGYFGTNANFDLTKSAGYIVLPKIETLGSMAFRKSWFDVVDLGSNLTKIWNDAFYQGRYDAVILRSPTLVPANTADAVVNITTLYCPSTLINDYKTATNWSNKASTRTVLPIEGSQYEHYYANGIPIE